MKQILRSMGGVLAAPTILLRGRVLPCATGLLALGAALATVPAAAQAYEPIYVVFSYHLDPLGPNPQVSQNNYPSYREAVQWATALSQSTGVKLSAGSTGPYAEGCVINGHETDFVAFMPGGTTPWAPICMRIVSSRALWIINGRTWAGESNRR